MIEHEPTSEPNKYYKQTIREDYHYECHLDELPRPYFPSAARVVYGAREARHPSYFLAIPHYLRHRHLRETPVQADRRPRLA